MIDYIRLSMSKINWRSNPFIFRFDIDNRIRQIEVLIVMRTILLLQMTSHLFQSIKNSSDKWWICTYVLDRCFVYWLRKTYIHSTFTFSMIHCLRTIHYQSIRDDQSTICLNIENIKTNFFVLVPKKIRPIDLIFWLNERISKDDYPNYYLMDFFCVYDCYRLY